MLWQLAATRRPDMQGIEGGIDRPASLAVLESRLMDDYRRGLLRSILAGAVWSGSRLRQAGVLASDVC
eukprot:3219235-Karenia_brevis.AAC.1